MKPKKWYKDKSRKEIAGVIAGLYDYFDLYENYGWKLENVRLVVIFLAIITNLPFLTAYIVLAILFPNFKLKLATHKKFTRRLVVQAFFRVIINPIFDKSDFFQSRFLGSFW